MKTTFHSYFFCLLATALAVCTSCGEEGDTTQPVINLIEPAEGDILTIGDEHGVHFELELADDVMLQSYKVNIHPNFDGHDHQAGVRSDSPETVDFTFNNSWDVSGQRNASVHHHEIKIPANATPGNYHLMVYCTDAAGNEAHVARNIVLSTEGGEAHTH